MSGGKGKVSGMKRGGSAAGRRVRPMTAKVSRGGLH